MFSKWIKQEAAVAAHTSFLRLMQELSKAPDTNSRINVFTNIGRIFDSTDTQWINHELRVTVQSSNVIQELVNVMKDYRQWAVSMPPWVKLILRVYKPFCWDMPIEQTQALVNVLLQMLDSTSNQLHSLLMQIFKPNANRLFYLDSAPLYDILKDIVYSEKCPLTLLLELTYDCAEWQKKISQDHQLVQHLCQRNEEGLPWEVLFNIAQHPDAKTLLPPSVLLAAREGRYDICKDICALLCNESEVSLLRVSKSYVETKKKNILQLLSSKTKMETGGNGEFNYSLLELVLPLVNVSVMEANKEIIGVHMIRTLLDIMETKHSPNLILYIADFLHRSKQETAKILWNLAFLELNKTLIAENNGIEILQNVLIETEDEILKTTISGVLFMFVKPETKILSADPKEKHVMISYSWADQPTVLRVANVLKGHNFKVWLDVEQMKGSTLEAMALAIEGAALVLMCVSQKYKDSPNCRLEAEYCIKQKVSLIPLMMQQNYQPDGWLGITMGSKLYHEFWSDMHWDPKKIERLVQEIKQALTADASTPQTTVQITAKDWTTDDVLAWLYKENLGRYEDLFAQRSATGGILLELKAILSSSQLVLPYFDRLGITDVFDVLQFTSALRKL